MGIGDLVGGLVGGDGDEEDGEQLDGDDDGLDGDLGDGDFDDLGGWEDEGDEELGDLGGGESSGSGAADLEPRLDELESELDRISSTMGTVQSENEAITETVDDLEDNVRKLLEIYEMVTRGVNPFVDGAEEGDTSGDDFSLFDGPDPAADTESDVADADADSFFEEDWDEDPAGEQEPEPEHEEGDTPAAEPEDEGEEGKTFDDLKSAYEGGEGDDGSDPSAAAETSEASDTDGVPEPTESAPADPPAASSSVPANEADADGKPYLTALPGGYGADLLVMEWLSFLRSASSTPEALRAIRYYETIGWLGPEAAESLAQYLSGLGAGDPPAAADTTQLSIDHHTRSLGYIGKLGGSEIQPERLQWQSPGDRPVHQEGGTQRGIQR